MRSSVFKAVQRAQRRASGACSAPSASPRRRPARRRSRRPPATRRRTTRRRSRSASRSSPTTPSSSSRRSRTRTATRSRSARSRSAAATSTSPATSRTASLFRRHPGHHARDRRRQLAERQLHLPPQVRLRAVEPRRLHGEGVVRALRHAAEPVLRLLRDRLPLPLPGDDLQRARGLPVVVRRRRGVPLQPAAELRRHPDRLLQRRELQPAGSQRSEGVHVPRHAASAAHALGPARPARDRVHQQGRLREERRSRRGPCSRRPSSTPTSMPRSSTWPRRIRRSATQTGDRRPRLVGVRDAEDGARLGRAAPLRSPRARTRT